MAMFMIAEDSPYWREHKDKFTKWEIEDTERGLYIRCPVCHFDGNGTGDLYCPSCGAKMDLED